MKEMVMLPQIGQYDPARAKAALRTSAGAPSAADGAVDGAVDGRAEPAGAASLQASASIVLRLAAEGAPVNRALVEEIRTAISEGRYPLDPAKIAAAMMAVDMPHPK
jgi:negative regulator of flagellin synthesis FlgM